MEETVFWAASPRTVLEVLRVDRERRKRRREREDWRAGVIAAETANAGGWKPKGKDRWEPRDFFPDLPKPVRRPMPWRDMMTILQGVNAKKGGKDGD